MQLKLNTRTLDGVTVVDCNGRIVFGEESAILRDTLKKLINENKRVVLNLGGVLIQASRVISPAPKCRLGLSGTRTSLPLLPSKLKA